MTPELEAKLEALEVQLADDPESESLREGNVAIGFGERGNAPTIDVALRVRYL